MQPQPTQPQTMQLHYAATRGDLETVKHPIDYHRDPELIALLAERRT